MLEGTDDATSRREDPRIGTTLAGKYRIDRHLGAGGMGVVYEATNTWTERRVAVKLLEGGRGGRVTLPPAAVDRFLLEAKIASRIVHPNVVAVFDLGRDDDGTLFLVQELLSGPTLDAHLAAHGALTPREALELLRPVMAALEAAHAAGVVHRDVKPENIILARAADGGITPTLLDFGVALVTAAAHNARVTCAGQVVGTPAFMSPEQASGESEIDARTDVWAVGLVWIEALTGRRLFDGQNYNEVLSRVLTRSIPPLRELCPGLPVALGGVLDRALRRDRNARHPSMNAFMVALDDAFKRPGSPPPPSPRRTRTALALVALTVVILVSALHVRTRARDRRPDRGAHPPAPPPAVALPRPSPPPDRSPPSTFEAQRPTPPPRRTLPERGAPTPGRAPVRVRAGTTNPVNGAPILEL